jgi:hypothetical protein
VAAWFAELEVLMKEHKFRQVNARALECVKFEKGAVSAETCDNAETFAVRHPGQDGAIVTYSPVGLGQLKEYLKQTGY